jgi:hypothetical protein
VQETFNAISTGSATYAQMMSFDLAIRIMGNSPLVKVQARESMENSK